VRFYQLKMVEQIFWSIGRCDHLLRIRFFYQPWFW